jgi:hypothetical protein
MSRSQFLESLFDTGRVTFGGSEEARSDEDALRIRRILEQAEQVRRLELPGLPPDWDEGCGLWAAEQFYRACRFCVQREQDAGSMLAALAEPCPAARSVASQHYCVDLVFRYLPDLYILAREAAREDPLLEKLVQWANEWPLSSVGMKNVESPQIEPLLDDPVLLRYYAERIITRRDKSRLTNPQVAEAVRAQLGMHSTLAPEIWEALSAS